MKLIINVTGECNLSCNYCYTPLETDKKILPLSNFKIFLEKMSKNQDNISLRFIGGEPLLPGVKYYEKVINIENKIIPSCEIRNFIQTNGTLINQELVEFFKQNNFEVGLSLDGPREVHNANRHYNSGRGSYDDVIKALKLLNDHSVVTGLISVLTSSSIGKEKRIIDEYLKYGVHSAEVLEYIPSWKTNNNLIPSSKEMGKMLINLYDYWMEMDNNIVLKPFHHIIKGFLLGKNSLCSYSGECTDYFITLNNDGFIYPCERLIGFKEFCLGNVIKSDLSQILDKKKNLNNYNNLCPECEYTPYCHGGCLYEKKIWKSKTMYCASRKMLFDHIITDLKI